MSLSKPFSLNVHGRLVQYSRPAVMGIINVTADSFYKESRCTPDTVLHRAEDLLAAGADMLDIGAYSSRPGADDVPAQVERERLVHAVESIRRHLGSDMVISVDTFRAAVAEAAINAGADIINDISSGDLDPEMFSTVARLKVPYILMHMRGTPATMQSLTDYDDVTAELITALSHKIGRLEELGVADIIVDPGFGFAKTLEQNYRILRQLESFAVLDRPILVGVSRKSMITRLLDIDTSDALCPTAIVQALAIERGASIIRTHDPLQAAMAVKILETTLNA